ncbi:ATP-binding protein [Spongisporangium articulatum]|uniref:ATP-binding protein n=1 Tax=Spongisporangium articulatum TaxID=3362603 RepID=A0ABW8AML1_9ACTN
MEWSLGPGDAGSARTIRHLITQALRDAAVPGSDLDSAELVVGELLSNVVVHTSGPARVCLSWDGRYPQLEVVDHGPGTEDLPWVLPQDPLATGGRGLYLVAQLARGVSVEARPTGGATITVTLDVPRADPHAL